MSESRPVQPLREELPDEVVGVLMKLAKLSYREREIAKLYLGLHDKEGCHYTLREIARIFKISSEESSAILSQAVAKMLPVIEDRERLQSVVSERAIDVLHHLRNQLAHGLLPEQDRESQVLPISIHLDPGDANAAEIAELLSELSHLYEMLGGSGISFQVIDAREPVLA